MMYRIYASSRESVAGKASCVQKNIQATEMDELAYDYMKKQVFK